MTERIDQIDAYVREFDARVVEVRHGEQPAVVLDRSAFYPGGGGQPCDLGELLGPAGPVAVTGVTARDGVVRHVVEGEPPSVGDSVRASIDWARRYELMRTHTAMHILCGVVWRDHGAQVTGGRMEPLRGRLDFEFESLRAELVQEIEAKLNAEVAADREVRVAVLPRDEAFAIPDLIRTKVNLLPPTLTEIRTIEIVGLDLQADGGTHVARTGEVGPLRIARYKSKGRINKRIEVELTAT